MVYFDRSRIKQALSQKNMTAIELSAIIGESPKKISDWINGRARINGSQVADLCNALECDANFFYPSSVSSHTCK